MKKERRSNQEAVMQPSCLENPMDGGAWWAAVHGVAKSRTRLSDFTFTFHFHALEKEMATPSSVLAWRIPGRGAWWAAVYGVAQSRTRLKRLSSSSNVNFRLPRRLSGKESACQLPVQGTEVWSLGPEDSLEKEMATLSSILVWRIPWAEEPGGLPSMRSQRVGHDLATEKQPPSAGSPSKENTSVPWKAKMNFTSTNIGNRLKQRQ